MTPIRLVPEEFKKERRIRTFRSNGQKKVSLCWNEATDLLKGHRLLSGIFFLGRALSMRYLSGGQLYYEASKTYALRPVYFTPLLRVSTTVSISKCCIMIIKKWLKFRLSVNTISWIVTGILFGKNADTRPALSLALLAWVHCSLFNLQCITSIVTHFC